MKNDINGVSTILAGEEIYEGYPHPHKNDITIYQYDYRHHSGELFSIVAMSLENAREKRDVWIKKGFK